MTPQQLATADPHAEVVRREKASRTDAAERLQLIAEVDRRPQLRKTKALCHRPRGCETAGTSPAPRPAVGWNWRGVSAFSPMS